MCAEQQSGAEAHDDLIPKYQGWLLRNRTSPHWWGKTLRWCMWLSYSWVHLNASLWNCLHWELAAEEGILISPQLTQYMALTYWGPWVRFLRVRLPVTPSFFWETSMLVWAMTVIPEGVLGRNGLSDLNPGGVLLLDFCGTHSLSKINTMFSHKYVLKWMWHQASDRLCNGIIHSHMFWTLGWRKELSCQLMITYWGLGEDAGKTWRT